MKSVRGFKRRRILLLVTASLVVAGLFLGADQVIGAQMLTWGRSPVAAQDAFVRREASRVTNAQRKAAAARLAALRAKAAAKGGVTGQLVGPSALSPTATPDYYGVPNYANSPLPDVDTSGNAVPAVPGTGGIRKFVDALPGLGPTAANDLGQYLPVATPDTTSYPGSDYYVIALVRYSQRLHSDLPPTQLQGYVQLHSDGTSTSVPASYLGPAIVAQGGRPVRVKFINKLPTNAGGDLFLPTDTTIMGAGMGPQGGSYSQNRATLHLHGGATPWISDGTPHQWTTPAGENTTYTEGVSVRNVPDMDGGHEPTGTLTFYYTNQQSARLMFYHDHSFGLTRLNVYAGEAAPYILRDSVEQTLVAGGTIKANGTTITVTAGTIPADEIPLVIQDKTFVPKDSQLASTDPTWDKAHWGGLGSLWLPHVYMPNQISGNDVFGNELDGLSAMGRWDYNSWFSPPVLGQTFGPVPNPLWGQVGQPRLNPGTPLPTIVPEAFMDTPLVNGTAYPFVQVGRKAYRFRILNASDDRALNLQLYFAKSNGQMWSNVTSTTLNDGDAGEVTMTVASPHPGDPNWPKTWPTDGRDGGVPDPSVVGPSMIQIGNEGGFLPSATVLPNTPVGYEYFRRTITVLNVTNKTLFLGPAERADVIVDFSGVADGSKLIMYNDAPAPVPAFDSRLDYYTGDPDQRDSGGAPSTAPGYGPNTRTVMQFDVQSASASSTFDVTNLAAGLKAAYAATQDKPIVPEAAYGSAFATTYPDNYAHATDTSMTFKPAGQNTPVGLNFGDKAIIEGFDTAYGRMNANLGGSLPNLGPTAGAAIPYAYVDPTTEIATNTPTGTQIGALADGTQIWRIMHQGVDTHAIHFHLFNVQVINRIALDGQLFVPDANELGWKETVRMNPGQDVIVALRPVAPTLPFKIPDSIRLLNPALSLGATWSAGNAPNVPPLPGAAPAAVVTNVMTNFGWEYVWHCHLLGHEENDMMRPFVFQVSPSAPTTLTATPSVLSFNAPSVTLTWTNHATNPAATMITVQRATNAAFTTGVTTFTVASNATSFVNSNLALVTRYYYRVRAENAVAYSTWSNTVTVVTPGRLPLAATNLHMTSRTRTSISIAWTNATTGQPRTGIRVQWGTGSSTGPFITSSLFGPNLSAAFIGALTPGRGYWVRIQSINQYGSTYSRAVSMMTLP